MGRGMGLLEKRLGESNGQFILGEEPCLGDFVLTVLTNIINNGIMDYVGRGVLERYPLLMGHREAVDGCDLVRKYVEVYGRRP